MKRADDSPADEANPPAAKPDDASKDNAFSSKKWDAIRSLDPQKKAAALRALAAGAQPSEDASKSAGAPKAAELVKEAQAVPFPSWFPDIYSRAAPVYLTLVRPATSDEETERIFRELGDWIEALDHPIAWIYDLSTMQVSPPSQRKMTADFLKRVEPAMKKHFVAVAFVVPNVFARGVLTAAQWLQSFPFPHKNLATRAEAVEWAYAALLARGARRLDPSTLESIRTWRPRDARVA